MSFLDSLNSPGLHIPNCECMAWLLVRPSGPLLACATGCSYSFQPQKEPRTAPKQSPEPTGAVEVLTRSGSWARHTAWTLLDSSTAREACPAGPCVAISSSASSSSSAPRRRGHLRGIPRTACPAFPTEAAACIETRIYRHFSALGPRKRTRNLKSFGSYYAFLDGGLNSDQKLVFGAPFTGPIGLPGSQWRVKCRHPCTSLPWRTQTTVTLDQQGSGRVTCCPTTTYLADFSPRLRIYISCK